MKKFFSILFAFTIVSATSIKANNNPNKVSGSGYLRLDLQNENIANPSNASAKTQASYVKLFAGDASDFKTLSYFPASKMKQVFSSNFENETGADFLIERLSLVRSEMVPASFWDTHESGYILPDGTTDWWDPRGSDRYKDIVSWPVSYMLKNGEKIYIRADFCGNPIRKKQAISISGGTGKVDGIVLNVTINNNPVNTNTNTSNPTNTVSAPQTAPSSGFTGQSFLAAQAPITLSQPDQQVVYQQPQQQVVCTTKKPFNQTVVGQIVGYGLTAGAAYLGAYIGSRNNSAYQYQQYSGSPVQGGFNNTSNGNSGGPVQGGYGYYSSSGTGTYTTNTGSGSGFNWGN